MIMLMKYIKIIMWWCALATGKICISSWQFWQCFNHYANIYWYIYVLIKCNQNSSCILPLFTHFVTLNQHIFSVDKPGACWNIAQNITLLLDTLTRQNTRNTEDGAQCHGRPSVSSETRVPCWHSWSNGLGQQPTSYTPQPDNWGHRGHAEASWTPYLTPPSYVGDVVVISKVNTCYRLRSWASHDDVIKWKHFPRYWPFVRGIHRWPVNSPHKGQWRGALICARINGWVNNREAGDLRRHRAYYDVTVMSCDIALRWMS